MKWSRPLLLLPLAVCTACVPLVREEGHTLAELPVVAPDLRPEPPPLVTRSQVVENYYAILDVSDDPAIRNNVLRRIADLEMSASEDQDLLGGAGLGHAPDFGTAIRSFQELLRLYPGWPTNDEVLYQLAKAYDLSADQENSLKTLDRLARDFPHSAYAVEAQFRRGEIYFTRGDFRTAESAYLAVLSQGRDSPLLENARYMVGWCRYKEGRLEDALQPFTLVLDHVLEGGADPEFLPRARRELLDDTLRVMALVFSELGGVDAVRAYWRQVGGRPYQYLVYDALAKLYLAQGKFGESSAVYRYFVEHYPQDPRAPQYHASLINVYLQGRMTEGLLTEKEAYVRRYGVHSDYWRRSGEAVRAEVLPHLKVLLDELARHYHALALKSRKAADFQRAAGWYQEFIDTFPHEPETARMRFLLGESLNEAGDFADAATAYEAAAYDYGDHPDRVEAAYGALLAYREQIKRAAPSERPALRRLKIDSELKFAEHFLLSDARAPKVLARAAEELLELKDYQQAVSAARSLVAWQRKAGAPTRRTAWLVIGHGSFALGHYGDAEEGYREALELTPAGDPLHGDVVERLAASIYRQAEDLQRRGERKQAAATYRRVAEAAPGSSIVPTARYDAAANLLALEDWDGAIAEMEALRRDYPRHPLVRRLPSMFALAFQETGRLAEAAGALEGAAAGEVDPRRKRKLLYQAAQLYEKVGDQQRAIAAYKRFASDASVPFDEVLEVRHKLESLYLQANEPDKRRYWLEKIIQADATAGAGNDRSRYLAAKASFELAEDARKAFMAIHLTNPLKKSLTRKRRALEEAIDKYAKTAQYGVEEFVTAATYRLGEVYGQLSRDLMASERPANLNELEREQYEILLEEQAFPFEEKAIEIHQTNAARTRDGVYDEWVKRSFTALGRFLPVRYDKKERLSRFSDAIH